MEGSKENLPLPPPPEFNITEWKKSLFQLGAKRELRRFLPEFSYGQHKGAVTEFHYLEQLGTHIKRVSQEPQDGNSKASELQGECGLNKLKHIFIGTLHRKKKEKTTVVAATGCTTENRVYAPDKGT